MGLVAGAEAPAYLRSKGKAEADSCAVLRNDNYKTSNGEMRGFFAALRMTISKGAALLNDKRRQKQIPPLRSTPASKDRSPGTPASCGMTNKMGSAEAGGEQDVLLDDALFEDGLAGVGLFVADLDPLLSHLCDKVLGFGFFGEFVGVFAGAVLLDEVGVHKSGEEARGVGDWGDLAATDAAFDGGPALRALFEAAFLPSAEIERAPTCTHEDDPFEGFAPHARVAGPVGPVGEVGGHDWYGITRGLVGQSRR